MGHKWGRVVITSKLRLINLEKLEVWVDWDISYSFWPNDWGLSSEWLSSADDLLVIA